MKKLVLTFLSGAVLGSGIMWFIHHVNRDQVASHQYQPQQQLSPESQVRTQVSAPPVGQAVSVGEISPKEIDNSERGPEADPGIQESQTQMESFERSVASDNEANQAPVEDSSSVAPEEAPPENIPEETEENVEEETK